MFTSGRPSKTAVAAVDGAKRRPGLFLKPQETGKGGAPITVPKLRPPSAEERPRGKIARQQFPCKGKNLLFGASLPGSPLFLVADRRGWKTLPSDEAEGCKVLGTSNSPLPRVRRGVRVIQTLSVPFRRAPVPLPSGACGPTFPSKANWASSRIHATFKDPTASQVGGSQYIGLDKIDPRD